MNLISAQLGLLAVFTGLITVRYIISLRKGIRPFLIFKKEKKFTEKIIEILPVAAVTLVILLILRKIFTPEIFSFLSAGFEMPFFLQLAGFIISFFSFPLLIAGYWALGSNWRVGTGSEEISELVTGGIFARTRNPVYLFFNLFLAGLFLINGDFSILILLMLIIASLHRIILEEEKLLLKTFGSVYESYKRSAPRYF